MCIWLYLQILSSTDHTSNTNTCIFVISNSNTQHFCIQIRILPCQAPPLTWFVSSTESGRHPQTGHDPRQAPVPPRTLLCPASSHLPPAEYHEGASYEADEAAPHPTPGGQPLPRPHADRRHTRPRELLQQDRRLYDPADCPKEPQICEDEVRSESSRIRIGNQNKDLGGIKISMWVKSK